MPRKKSIQEAETYNETRLVDRNELRALMLAELRPRLAFLDALPSKIARPITYPRVRYRPFARLFYRLGAIPRKLYEKTKEETIQWNR
ncbi:MAG: hypothetical protein ACE145_13655 [Terriglobia bacterium]